MKILTCGGSAGVLDDNGIIADDQVFSDVIGTGSCYKCHLLDYSRQCNVFDLTLSVAGNRKPKKLHIMDHITLMLF